MEGRIPDITGYKIYYGPLWVGWRPYSVKFPGCCSSWGGGVRSYRRHLLSQRHITMTISTTGRADLLQARTSRLDYKRCSAWRPLRGSCAVGSVEPPQLHAKVVHGTSTKCRNYGRKCLSFLEGAGSLTADNRIGAVALRVTAPIGTVGALRRASFSRLKRSHEAPAGIKRFFQER
jgi:hypothetical protein